MNEGDEYTVYSPKSVCHLNRANDRRFSESKSAPLLKYSYDTNLPSSGSESNVNHFNVNGNNNHSSISAGNYSKIKGQQMTAVYSTNTIAESTAETITSEPSNNTQPRSSQSNSYSNKSNSNEHNNEKTEDFLRVKSMTAYRSSLPLTLFYWSLAIFSCGISLLLTHWFKNQTIALRYKKCQMDKAEYVLVEGELHGAGLVKVEKVSPESEAERKSHPKCKQLDETLLNPHSSLSSKLNDEKMIVFRHERFLYNPVDERFERLQSATTVRCRILNDRLKSGLSHREASELLFRFGLNAINIIVPSIPSMLINDIVHPFYIFQLYTIILWIVEEYTIFAICVAIVACVSLTTTLIATRRQLTQLSEMARFEAPVRVRRSGETVTLSSTQLCVGDIIEIETGLVPVDVVLVNGAAVVNEAMLTGESVPIVKSSIQWPVNRDSDQSISLNADARNVLFSATEVLQLKPESSSDEITRPVLGVVTKTGFHTAKGSLILSILFPQPSTFKFVSQSHKFIFLLFIVAIGGLAVSIWQLHRMGASTTTMVIRGLDLTTIVVPPALAIALTVATSHALFRLKDKLIFCISPSKINIAGKIRLVAFDKTGTLTIEGLGFTGVLAAKNGKFVGYQTYVGNFSRASSRRLLSQSGDLNEIVIDIQDDFAATHAHAPTTSRYFQDSHAPVDSEIVLLMSSCHALAILDDQTAPIGDPLEVEIFKATQAQLRDTGSLRGYKSIINVPNQSLETNSQSSYSTASTSLGVVQQFEFSSSLQRMSVIVRNESTQELRVYCKGSAEMLQKLCLENTLPPDFEEALTQYSHAGYRVIALANKKIDSIPEMDINALRTVMERDLVFMGFLMLENKVKEETPAVLEELSNAKIRCIMVTGDHALTALSVAKSSGMVHERTRIFLARLKDKQYQHISGPSDLEFVDTEPGSNLKLDPYTLTVENNNTNECFPYEIAMTGSIFQLLHGMIDSADPMSYFHRLIVCSQIFARMNPTQKAQLIASLQQLGLYCAFAGDGANDSGALRTSHVGISLSCAESSIAAPFTYQRPNIECVPILLKEGRCTLIASFELFKFIAMYSIIQFTAVLMTYFVGSVLGNWQYLVQDFWIVFIITLCLGATGASSRLSIKRPSGNLLSLATLSSIFIHSLICIAFQLIVFKRTQAQSDYVELPNPDNGPTAQESTSLFYLSNFQYLIVGTLFAFGGSKWKASPFSNKKLTAWIVLNIFLCTSLLLMHKMPMDDVDLAYHFKVEIFGWVILHVLISTLWDMYLLPVIVKLYKRFKLRNEPKGTFFGIPKPIHSLIHSKPVHRLRGEFEENFSKLIIETSNKKYFPSINGSRKITDVTFLAGEPNSSLPLDNVIM